MADVAQLGVQVTNSGVNETAAGLTKLSGAAARAQADTENLSNASLGAVGASSAAAKAYADVGSSAVSSSKQIEMLNRAANQNNAALNATVAPSKNVANQARMMALQLSQVAQQTQASGNFIQALAIQLPDLATGFGAVGIAIGVAAGVALQYFGTLIGSGEASAKVLQQQQQLITSTAEAWGDAVPALTDYVDQLERAKSVGDLDASVKILNEQTVANVKASIEDLRASFANLTQDLRQAGEEDQNIINLQRAFDNFVDAAQNGKDVTSEVQTVQEALAASINSTGLPALAAWATQFDGVAQAAANAAGQVEKLSNSALTAKIFGNDKLSPLSSLSIYDGKIVANDQNPAGTVVTDDGRYVPVPSPSSRPSPYGFAPLKAGGAGRRAGGLGAHAYDSELRSLSDRTKAIQAETAAQAGLNPTINDYGFALAKAKASADLLAAAEKQKLAITPQLKAQIDATSTAYAQAVEAQNRQTEATKKAKQAVDDAKDATKGFLTDLRTGLQNGEGFWQSFGKAASGVLDKIIGKIEDQLVDALFSATTASKGATGGGIFGSLFSGLGKLLGFANGTSSAPGGLAWVGERGPEIVNLPRGSQVIPAHRVSQVTNGGGTNVKVTVDWAQGSNGNIAPIVKSVSQQTVGEAAPKIVSAANQQVLPTVAAYQANKRGGDYRLG